MSIEKLAEEKEALITAAMELERKILELIKQEEPLFYMSDVAKAAVMLVRQKFS